MAEDESRPARGYSWPPFEAGHTKSLVHGADSERAIEARAAELRPKLFELCPWLEEHDVIAVARFLRVETRSLILDAYMAEIIDQAGPGKVPIRMWEQANATDRLAGDLGSKLGLDTAGRAQLRQTVASTTATLEDIAQDGRRARQRRAGVIDAEALPDDGAEA
ncbi:MAG TPA: hypothetical protein VK283_10635 [Acidimicrobiales bacterium]|nr:hypothetical protein [Acidimicrobiales bacterium]HLN05858.1 hypothetical protein [Acidimicrobiales bacterium]